MGARGLHLATIARHGAAARVDRAQGVGLAAGPEDDIAAVTGRDRIGRDRGARAHVDARRVGDAGVLAVEAAADQHSAAARVAGGVEAGAVQEGDVGAGDDDMAAGLARAGACRVERAGHIDLAALHVAQERDDTVAVADTARLDDAGVVDRGLEQLSGRLGGQHHLAAVGADHAAVLHQRVHRALVNRDVEQAVAGHVEGDRLAAGQGHRAEVGDDDAIVADAATQEGDIAAAVHGDRATVQHRAAAGAGKAVVALHEVGVGDVERRGHQAADIDLRSGREQHAVGIDHEHLAVGAEAAEDAGRVGAEHPVQSHRTGVRLHEPHRLAAPDVEALPVDHGVLAGLVDGQRAGPGRQAGAARGDLAAGRQGEGRRAHHQGQGGGEHQARAQPGAAGDDASIGVGADGSKLAGHGVCPLDLSAVWGSFRF